MPPKSPTGGKKKGKKSKAALEEERRQEEERLRLEEEEQQRLAEEERVRQEELEKKRLELLAALDATENERIKAEFEQLGPYLGQEKLERMRGVEQRQKDWEWERYLACTYIPHPKERVVFSDYLRCMQEGSDTDLKEALTTCQDCYHMIDEAMLMELQERLQSNEKAEAMHAEDVQQLHKVVGLRVDRMTAHMLQYSDEHGSAEKEEIQLGMRLGEFDLALWINVVKNARRKAVELAVLQMIVEIPKQITLANLAMRVYHRAKDEFFTACTNELMAVGGVLYVDLLALPPPSKPVNTWVLRQVTPLATSIARIPYPIPPAGTDPLTWRPEEEPPPLGFAMPFSGHTSLVMEDHPQSRTRLLPYNTWNIRPTGGKNGKTVAVTLSVPSLQELIIFEVGPGYVSLQEPVLEALEPIMGKQMAPEHLLLTLSSKGLHLLPEDRDAQFTGVTAKEKECERAMCMDLARLGGTFLIARSKFNQSHAKPDECIARISPVTDWEAGGRTEPHHLQRIFTKEKEDGERRVLAVIQRGTKGIAYINALDKHQTFNALPGHESVDAVQACTNTVWGEVHACLLSLLKGVEPKANDRPAQKDAEEEHAPIQEEGIALRLRMPPETLEMVHTTDPLLTLTLGQLLMLLRVFSFS
ncbi:hypothetical protein DUNSADRAFT_7024 [Dunaliella salina]|uniref:IC97/Casc1 N-terminal domain-containing protein n=1 Tax=Dunaliella salina TaxID=3046 RepID=A0ABQ7GM21_DUNSA|nr:hypothetical protein DUNSADRAFT_7024 [Dunaliella salina]|eukprot:KAF5835664.1 hypothetical protein DUNSADRAFT_7024 [Dunaliella salina]